MARVFMTDAWQWRDDRATICDEPLSLHVERRNFVRKFRLGDCYEYIDASLYAYELQEYLNFIDLLDVLLGELLRRTLEEL